MKLSQAIAVYERCMSRELIDSEHCEGCPINLKMGAPEDVDALGVAYTISACLFLGELEARLKGERDGA